MVALHSLLAAVCCVCPACTVHSFGAMQVPTRSRHARKGAPEKLCTTGKGHVQGPAACMHACHSGEGRRAAPKSGSSGGTTHASTSRHADVTADILRAQPGRAVANHHAPATPSPPHPAPTCTVYGCGIQAECMPHMKASSSAGHGRQQPIAHRLRAPPHEPARTHTEHIADGQKDNTTSHRCPSVLHRSYIC